MLGDQLHVAGGLGRGGGGDAGAVVLDTATLVTYSPAPAAPACSPRAAAAATARARTASVAAEVRAVHPGRALVPAGQRQEGVQGGEAVAEGEGAVPDRHAAPGHPGLRAGEDQG